MAARLKFSSWNMGGTMRARSERTVEASTIDVVDMRKERKTFEGGNSANKVIKW